MWAHLLWGVIGHELRQNGQRLPARPIDEHDVLRLRPLRFDCYGEWGARGRRRWPVNYPATCRAHRLGLMPGCGDPERPPELRGERRGKRDTRGCPAGCMDGDPDGQQQEDRKQEDRELAGSGAGPFRKVAAESRLPTFVSARDSSPWRTSVKPHASVLNNHLLPF